MQISLDVQKPWIESLLVLNGAASVTTLEYSRIDSRHPKITAMTPQEMSEKFLQACLHCGHQQLDITLYTLLNLRPVFTWVPAGNFARV